MSIKAILCAVCDLSDGRSAGQVFMTQIEPMAGHRIFHFVLIKKNQPGTEATLKHAAPRCIYAWLHYKMMVSTEPVIMTRRNFSTLWVHTGKSTNKDSKQKNNLVKMSWASGIFLIVVVALVQAKPQYEVQVQSPVSFSYAPGNQNQLFDGTCCSPNESCLSEETNCCFTACNETQITLCFREAQHSTNDSDSTNCPLGMATVLSDTVAYNSTANLTTTTTTYTGSFQLFYKVVALQPVREIDHGVSTLNYTIQDIFVRPIVNSGERSFLLIRGIRVVCREGYFGPDCGCRDNSTGHFTCDANGTKVCLPGYQNPETNCTEEALITPEPTTETVPTANPASQTTETSQPTPQTIQQNITTFITEALTTIGITNAGTTMDVLPIAVGGAVGGLVVVVIIILITILLVLKTKRKKKSEEDATTIMNLEELQNNTDGIDALNLYASVNKDANKCAETPQEEAPAVIPYQGQIYSEVEKTGLFGKQESDSTSEEPQYSTATAGTSKLESVDENEEPSSPNAASASTQALNEEPRYDTTFRGASTATGTNEEPHYSTAIRNVPSNTATQMQINEAGYSILNGDPKRFENVNIGPEYSKLEGTTQVTQHQVQDESQYSELETTKKPEVQIYVAGYSALEEPRYSEIESETKQPQIVYADLEIADTQSADKATTQTSDNMNTTEVQYSHIKNGQSV
ncbi:uncharacterized protein LOC135330900 isoform X2 [Halichondria panicea]|uniref:uncharacterized protein LOC135330900 isoform X2 n=1 Tax=Halichondria panicea TaxID=6063 RepID=UPI00312B5CC3